MCTLHVHYLHMCTYSNALSYPFKKNSLATCNYRDLARFGSELYDTINKDFLIFGIIQFEPKAGLAPVYVTCILCNTQLKPELIEIRHLQIAKTTKEKNPDQLFRSYNRTKLYKGEKLLFIAHVLRQISLRVGRNSVFRHKTPTVTLNFGHYIYINSRSVCSK